MSSFKPKVVLVPWDFDSPAHRQILQNQRQECTWHHDKVEKEWRDAQEKGQKCIYWIVSYHGKRYTV